MQTPQEETVSRLLMIASCYGLEMTPAPPASYTHIPLSLFPSVFPKQDFLDLISKTTAHNSLMFSVSQNQSYLSSCLSKVCEIDTFTNRLLSLSQKSHLYPHYQDIFLGLTRNDFMYDQHLQKFLQVEFNTISASFVSLGSRIIDFHEQVVDEYASLIEYRTGKPLENNALFNFANAMKVAYELYGNKGYVLFVVLEDEKNLFDQTLIEIELWKNW